MAQRQTGFLLLTPEQRKQLGSKGGKRRNELSKQHHWTREQAVEMARKSAEARRRRKEAQADGE